MTLMKAPSHPKKIRYKWCCPGVGLLLRMERGAKDGKSKASVAGMHEDSSRWAVAEATIHKRDTKIQTAMLWERIFDYLFPWESMRLECRICSYIGIYYCTYLSMYQYPLPIPVQMLQHSRLAAPPRPNPSWLSLDKRGKMYWQEKNSRTTVESHGKVHKELFQEICESCCFLVKFVLIRSSGECDGIDFVLEAS